jgi:hypothetical protein
MNEKKSNMSVVAKHHNMATTAILDYCSLFITQMNESTIQISEQTNHLLLLKEDDANMQ